ncbi:tetratricopeptide repeat protein [Chloroflexota bacterium]
MFALLHYQFRRFIFAERPNIVQAQGFEYLDGQPLIFLEYVSGGSLRSLLHHNELPILDILKMGVQICRGMRHAYSMGLAAHRDIKPDNILLTAEHTARVTDFGLVKLMDEALSDTDTGFPTPLNRPLTTTSLTRIDAPGFGTKEYMPPEQWRSAAKADNRSDIYSFGVMLYEMLTGIRPFFGNTPQALRNSHFNDEPVPPSTLRPDIPQSVDTVVQRCLQKRPADRFENFTLLHNELVRILQQEYRGIVRILTQEQLSIAELNERGAALFNLRKYTQALDCFNKVLAHDQQHTLGWANRGVTLAELNRHDEALNSFNRALQITPQNAIVLTNKGLTLFERGDYQQAFTCYDQAVKADHTLQEAWRYRSEVLNRLGSYEPAYYSASKAQHLDQRDARASYQAAFALVHMGRIESAQKAINQYAQLVGPQNSGTIFLRSKLAYSQDDLQECLLLSAAVPNTASEYHDALLLGMACALTLGYWDEVAALVKTMPAPILAATLQLMLATLQKTKTPVVQLLALACEVAFWVGDYYTAYTLYQRWDQQWQLVGKPDDAVPQIDLQAITEQYLDDPEQLISLGGILLSIGKPRSAIPFLRQALSAIPENTTGWMLLGEALNICGEFAEALVAYEKLLNLLPDEPAIQLSYVEAAMRAEGYKAGLKILKKAKKTAPHATHHAFLYGIALMGQEKYNEALKKLDTVLQAEPDHALALWNKGLCLGHTTRHAEANRYLHAARQRDLRLWNLAPGTKKPVLLFPLTPTASPVYPGESP